MTDDLDLICECCDAVSSCCNAWEECECRCCDNEGNPGLCCVVVETLCNQLVGCLNCYTMAQQGGITQGTYGQIVSYDTENPRGEGSVQSNRMDGRGDNAEGRKKTAAAAAASKDGKLRRPLGKI